MRLALWLLALFGVAVSVALGLSQQFGTVTLFVPPYRVDMSLNLVVMGTVLCFVLIYMALRGLFGVFELPAQARRWRAQQRERVAQAALLNAMVLWMTGRYTRSRKAALKALNQVESLLSVAPADTQASLGLMRSLLHLLAAESAHALRDKPAREQHFQQVLAHSDSGARVEQKLELRDAAFLNAVRWALHDRDNSTAQQYLAQLPHGTATGAALAFEGRSFGATPLARLGHSAFAGQARCFCSSTGAQFGAWFGCGLFGRLP